MQALAGERVEEPGRIADEQPALAGPARHPLAKRRCPGDLVAWLLPLRQSASGSSAARGMAPQDRPGDSRGAVVRQFAPSAGAGEDDADVQAPAGDGCDAAVGTVEHDHPPVARRDAAGIREVVGQPTRGPSGAGRTTPARRATIERSPSAPAITTVASTCSSPPAAQTRPPAVRVGSSPRRTAAPRRTLAPRSLPSPRAPHPMRDDRSRRPMPAASRRRHRSAERPCPAGSQPATRGSAG